MIQFESYQAAEQWLGENAIGPSSVWVDGERYTAYYSFQGYNPWNPEVGKEIRSGDPESISLPQDGGLAIFAALGVYK